MRKGQPTAALRPRRMRKSAHLVTTTAVPLTPVLSPSAKRCRSMIMSHIQAGLVRLLRLSAGLALEIEQVP